MVESFIDRLGLLTPLGCHDGLTGRLGGGGEIESLNPATGQTLAQVPRMGAGETRRAIEAAK